MLQFAENSDRIAATRKKLDKIALVAAYLSFDWAVGAVIHNRKVVLVPERVLALN